MYIQIIDDDEVDDEDRSTDRQLDRQMVSRSPHN